MIIRDYQAGDKEHCIAVFHSNYHLYFDKEELAPFINWLDHQSSSEPLYNSPTYTNSKKDAYYVVELPGTGVVGCGGFYIVKDQQEARLAWGMIHSGFHKKGLGTELFAYRKMVIHRDWPGHTIVLGTSQHTYPFYERMGMRVTETFPAGYGPTLDRYDMVL